MSEMSRAWGAISNDIDKLINKHTEMYERALKKNTEREHIWAQKYERGLIDGLLEAQSIVSNHIGSD